MKKSAFPAIFPPAWAVPLFNFGTPWREKAVDVEDFRYGKKKDNVAFLKLVLKVK